MMRRVILGAAFLALLPINSSGQIRNIFKKDSINVRNLKIDNSNTWAIGGGVSNFIMHGDLRSIGTGTQGNFWNFGAYAYIDKMFNPLLGLEFRIDYTKISGGAQYLSNVYDILYVKQTNINNNLFFKGRAYGAELNLIFSFTNLYKTHSEAWNFSGYFGGGFHQYNSALYEKLPNGTTNKLVDFGHNPSRNNKNEASSIYISAQLGVKRRLNKRVDLELRSGIFFNNEDHLDATISNKQDWESFFVTSIGLVVKLGRQKIFTIWGDQSKKPEPFKVIDSDNDGVMDKLDVEPNTPKGVLVYGNGKAIDSDQDGLPDYKDKCPLDFGPIANNGCPIKKVVKTPPPAVKEQIALLATSVYFKNNSSNIKQVSFSVLDEIIDIMKKFPDTNFVIEGHTDSKSNADYNLALSQKRAEAVKNYFINAGINNNRLNAIGYGETRPKYSNNTADGRQLNRRVEIKPISKIQLEDLKLLNKKNAIKTNRITPKSNENSDKTKRTDAKETFYHTVKNDETLYGLATTNHTTVKELKRINSLVNSKIYTGQRIKIVKNSKNYHKVQKNETLSSIALKYHLSVEELKSLNKLKGNTIFINQELKVTKE